jgi:hypothetical protein
MHFGHYRSISHCFTHNKQAKSLKHTKSAHCLRVMRHLLPVVVTTPVWEQKRAVHLHLLDPRTHAVLPLAMAAMEKIQQLGSPPASGQQPYNAR